MGCDHPRGGVTPLPPELLPPDAVGPDDSWIWSPPGNHSEYANTQCAGNLTLVLSVKITEQRDDAFSTGARRHRFSRLEIFAFALRSYAALKVIRRVFLFIDLDGEFVRYQSFFQKQAAKLLGPRLVTMSFRRLTTQAEWRKVLPAIAPPSDDRKHHIWFSQNDDHVFVDSNEDILREGLLQAWYSSTP